MRPCSRLLKVRETNDSAWMMYVQGSGPKEISAEKIWLSVPKGKARGYLRSFIEGKRCGAVVSDASYNR